MYFRYDAASAPARRSAVAAVIALSFFAPHVYASATLPIFGMTTYSPGAGGYQGGVQYTEPGHAASNRYLILNATGVDAAAQSHGQRALRWDATTTSSVELDHTGLSSFGSAGMSVYAVNNDGTAIGAGGKYGATGMSLGTRAVRWNSTGTAFTELGLLNTRSTGFASVSGIAINEIGTAVGSAARYNAQDQSLGLRPVRWDAGQAAATELAVFNTAANGTSSGGAWALNDAGTIVGTSRLYGEGGVNLGLRAARWDAGGTAITQLDSIGFDSAGATSSAASAINSAGTVVGYGTKYAVDGTSQGIRAVRWNAGGTAVTELGGLGTDASGSTTTNTLAINDAGTIIGQAYRYEGGVYKGNRAVRWSAGGTIPTELGNLGASANGIFGTTVNGLNNMEFAVGEATEFSSTLGNEAVLWRPDGVVVKLSSFLPAQNGWDLSRAFSISDTGFIGGIGTFQWDLNNSLAAYERLFVMLVPEAGTYGRGDANFDTLVNFDDLLILAQNYGEANASQNIHVGDLNLDGNVDFDDLLALAQHYGSGAVIDTSSLGSTFTSDWALARSMVPEPVLGIGAILAFGLLRRGHVRR